MTRQSDYDKRRLKQGWRRLRAWLSPEAGKSLAQLVARWDCSSEEAVRRALDFSSAMPSEIDAMAEKWDCSTAEVISDVVRAYRSANT
jgi:hypothetical protein